VSKDGAALVMNDIGRSLWAVAVSRDLLQQRWPACAEEASIAAMFPNIGRSIAAAHVPDAMAAVRAAIQDGQRVSVVTSRLIGRAFDERTLEVVGGWGLPPPGWSRPCSRSRPGWLLRADHSTGSGSQRCSATKAPCCTALSAEPGGTGPPPPSRAASARRPT